MKYLAAAALALSLMVSPAGAQTADPAAADPAAGSLPSPPDPRALKAGWWSYFQSDGKVHVDRFPAARSVLASLVAQSDSPRVAEYHQRFGLSLDALAGLAAAPPPQPPVGLVIKAEYSLPELLELENQRLDMADANALERGVAERLESAARAARKRLDSDFAAYLSLADNSPNRLARGLRVMAERAALAVTEARLERARGTLQVRSNSLAEVEAAASAARDRLKPAADALTTLGAEMESAQAALDQATEALRQREDEIVPAIDAAGGGAQERLRGLSVIQASVEVALARTRLSRLDAQQDWVALRDPAATADKQAITERFEARTRHLDTLGEELAEWRAVAQREVLDLADLDSEDAALAQLSRDRLAIAQKTLLEQDRLRRSAAELKLINDLVGQELSGRKGLFERGLSSSFSGARNTYRTARDLLGTSLFRIGDTPVTTLGLLRLVLILLIALWVSRILRGMLQRFANRRDTADQSAFYTVGRLAHYLIIVVGVMVGLSSIGLNLSNLALVAGALSVGIGFGLQSIVNNFVSGLIILFERSLKVGDFIELGSGLQGTVKEINVRSTLINTNDNIDIVVPNSEFVSSRLTNWTLRDADRRVHVSFGVAYGTDKEKVRDAVLEAAARVPFTRTAPKDKRPQVWLVGFGDSSLDFELVVWLNPDAVRRPSAVQARYTWEIETALGQAGIEIPFPQRDLHLRSGFPKGPDDTAAPAGQTEPAAS